MSTIEQEESKNRQPDPDLQETVETYDRSAEALAEYFRGIGPRTDDIDRAFKLAGNPKNPKILEIGCGDGRDAKDIITRTNWYLGFDISEGMLGLARNHVPEAEFEVGDATSFKYPPDLDIVFAFASLLHMPEESVHHVLNKVADVLKPSGIFYISLKYAPEYSSIFKEDEYGRRKFYLYNPEIIEELAGPNYEVVYSARETIGSNEWFETALRRIDDTRG
jgi:SAM-dependent methyltransferase